MLGAPVVVPVALLVVRDQLREPLAQRAIKRVVNKGLTMDPAALEEYGRMLSDELWRTEDHREGVASHVEKRKPVFRER